MGQNTGIRNIGPLRCVAGYGQLVSWRNRTNDRNRLNDLVLRLALMVGALLFSPLPGVAVTSSSAIPTQMAPPNVAEQYLLNAANQERVARGLLALHRDPVLAQAAYYHALQMADHGGISHQFPGEPDLSERGSQVGVRFSLITENVAEAPNSSMLHTMWMHSEGHRRNLLDPNVNIVGIAVVSRGKEFFAVEDFASNVESLSYSQQERSVASLLANAGLHVGPTGHTSTLDEARRTCSLDSGFAGHEHKPWFIMRYTASRLDELPQQLTSRLSSGKFHQAVVGACADNVNGPFTAYNIAVLLYP